MPRQIDAVAQRRGGLGAGGDHREVENGKRDHASKLVPHLRRTKGRGAAHGPFNGSLQDAWADFSMTFRYSIRPILIFTQNARKMRKILCFRRVNFRPPLLRGPLLSGLLAE